VARVIDGAEKRVREAATVITDVAASVVMKMIVLDVPHSDDSISRGPRRIKRKAQLACKCVCVRARVRVRVRVRLCVCARVCA
jgi:hypothetical protein